MRVHQAFKIAASGLPRVAAGYVVGDTELATALGATTGDIVVMKTTVDDAIRETFSGNAASKMDVRSFITSFVDKYAYDDGVLVLEDDNFSDAVREWGSMLVEFYAPVRVEVPTCVDVCLRGDLTCRCAVAQWCGHCKQLAPKYVEAARQLKEFDPSLAIAKVGLPHAVCVAVLLVTRCVVRPCRWMPPNTRSLLVSLTSLPSPRSRCVRPGPRVGPRPIADCAVLLRCPSVCVRQRPS